jgi:putative restriction endonuclease
MPGPVFGHIPGYPVGSWFENRAELAEAGVHRHRQAGISGSASKGADSIVLSGGYEDDLDFGNLIIYTGYGGRNPATGRQVSDQPFSLWNRALAYSSLNGLPVAPSDRECVEGFKVHAGGRSLKAGIRGSGP